MDLTFGKEELAFQQEVRDWLKECGTVYRTLYAPEPGAVLSRP